MSIENSGSPSGEDHDKARRDLLLKVYDAAINEYRFNVQLGWDRTKFFLGLAVTGIAAGAGLIRLAEGSKVVPLFLCFFFALLVGITWSGWLAAEKSKKYTRRAVLTKTLVERELGLLRNVEDLHDPALHLAIAVTPGHRDFRDILFNHAARAEKRPDPGSAVARVEWITWLLIAIELAGLVFSWVSFCLQLGSF